MSRRPESQFRALLEAAPDAMVIADGSGRIGLVNAQAEKLFGYARDELLGQPVEILIPERFRGGHVGHRAGYFRDPRARPMGAGGPVLFGRRRDGSEFPVEISLSPLETAGGTVAITAIRDVSERRAADAERARLHAELQGMLADQKRFFANVSHELRTPLSLILGPAERLLAAAPAGGPHRSDLEVMVRNARTLLRHVNDLLDVARLDAGRMELTRADEDAAALLRAVTAHFAALADERTVTLQVDAADQLPFPLDAPKFQRIAVNLLSNAFRFTPAGGRIRCALALEADRALRLEVADSGPGIPPAHREEVFRRFRQLDTGGPAGGTGLGLAIAQEFAALHGGSIAVEDAPEGGALLRVLLPWRPAATHVRPAVDPAEARHAAEALRQKPAPTPGEQGGLPRVLVAEDNPDMAGWIRDVLSGQASVSLAGGGREALERFPAVDPDLLVTDLMMAEGGGEELLQAVRSRPEWDDVPVLVLTARADDALRARLLRAGAQDYVLKPFGAEELQARAAVQVEGRRVRRLLRQALDSRSRDLETLARALVLRNRDLEAALEAARAARDEATRASRVKGDFLALVSHELRTPLATLRLHMARLAGDPAASARGRAVIPRMSATSRRLETLVEGLLEHSRIASGRLDLRREQVSLARLVEEAVEELRPLAEDRAIALRVSCAKGLPTLWSDPAKLRVVVSNLVGNAIKFTERGAVEVSVALQGGEQVVAVADSGPGIPEAERDRIFEPFEQLSPVRGKHMPGFGLGLALVREICAALGARVELRSEVGVGSTFTVRLPVGPSARPGARVAPRT